MIRKRDDAIGQCRENIEAVLAHYGFPPLQVMAVQSDRLTALVTPESLDHLEKLVDAQDFLVWKYNKNHGSTAKYGWREAMATCSMQIVLHEVVHGELVYLTFEIDIDEFNPGMGVAPAIAHTGEVLRNKLTRGKTDPFRIALGLYKRGIPVRVIGEQAEAA